MPAAQPLFILQQSALATATLSVPKPANAAPPRPAQQPNKAASEKRPDAEDSASIGDAASQCGGESR
ncbi:hypothetical protein HDU84_000762, partial [Entophlyctis sp. JEL0112]